MLRGVLIERPNWLLNYTAYFSVSQTTDNLQAGRAAGGRIGMFLPKAGIEVGASYQRFLQNGDHNDAGTYFAWQPPQIPLDVRAEYAHSPGGQGYWLEGAMRVAWLQGHSPWKVGDCRHDQDQALLHHRRQASKKSAAKFRAQYRGRKRRIFAPLCRVSRPGWTEHRSAFRRSHVAPVPMLSSSEVQSYTDGQLKWVIDNGISPTGMPGSTGILTDSEIWSIVVYIRHLPPAGSLGEPAMYSGDPRPTPTAQVR